MDAQTYRSDISTITQVLFATVSLTQGSYWRAKQWRNVPSKYPNEVIFIENCGSLGFVLMVLTLVKVTISAADFVKPAPKMHLFSSHWL